MKTTSIEWCDHTFNPWWGCTRVSPGCEHCYAETFSKRLGKDLWGPTADRRFFGPSHWAEPYAWDRAAMRAGTMRRVFCASMADICEDHPITRVQNMLNGARQQLARVIYDTPNLEWLLLTKRIEHFTEVFPVELFERHEYPGNIRVGTTAENQAYADERIPHLLQIPLPNFISIEPLLGPVDLHSAVLQADCDGYVEWVIVGGESGGQARPCCLSWVRNIVYDCQAAGVPVFVKQYGAKPYETTDAADAHKTWPVGHFVKLKDRKGGDLAEWESYLRVREFPTMRVSA